MSFAHPAVSRWKRSEAELYIEKPRETRKPLISFTLMRVLAQSLQVIINKDLVHQRVYCKDLRGGADMTSV